MEAVTNGQTIEWYKVNLENGNISEAKIKTEAVKFFDLSDEHIVRRPLKEAFLASRLAEN